MTEVLMVVTGASTWTLRDGTQHATGYWAEEVAEPHRIFTEAGWRVTVATPGGRPAVVDALSLGLAGGAPAKRRRVHAYLDSIAATLAAPEVLADVDEDAFGLVFYPGGHGPMEDLARDAVSGALLARRLRSGRPLALLCHGPAAVLAATNPDGTNAFRGYRMTALSNTEERLNTFAWKAKWLLQDALRQAGVDYAKGAVPLRSHVVVDRNLYSGQNPASAAALAERIVAEFGEPVFDIAVSREVAAPRQVVYDYVSDLGNMGEISPENARTRWTVPGRRFIGRNRIGPFYRWSMTGSVTEAIPGESFGFLTDSPSESYWRYTFADAPGGGTLVTESMRKYRPQIRPVVALQDISGARDRRAHLRAGMTETLDALARRLER